MLSNTSILSQPNDIYKRNLYTHHWNVSNFVRSKATKQRHTSKNYIVCSFFSPFFSIFKNKLEKYCEELKSGKIFETPLSKLIFQHDIFILFFSFFINITIANHSTRLFVRLWSAHDKKRKKISNLNEKKTREKN